MTLSRVVLSATRDHTCEVNRLENLFYGRTLGRVVLSGGSDHTAVFRQTGSSSPRRS